jgi:hypothetical protein
MKNFIFILFMVSFTCLPTVRAQSHQRSFQPKTSFNKQNRPQKNAFQQAETNPLPPQTEHSEPQTTYLLTELSFWMHDLEYTGLLAMENGAGKMRIHYDNPQDPDGCKIIEQTMRLVQTTDGNYYLEGSNPVDVRTGRWANYNADNIFIFQDEEGELVFVNRDMAGNRAPIEMQTITSESRLKKLRRFYRWDE